MIVDYFSDYLAYTFEENDSMFGLGMRLVSKSSEDMISAVDVVHNGRIRLLYGIEGYKNLSEAVGNLTNSELAVALKRFINSIRKIEDNDFLNINAIDINYNRLFYDVKKQCIKYIMLPVNYECNLHDEENWTTSFRRTILLLLNHVFAKMPEKYNDLYYYIMDVTKTDFEIIAFLSQYDFGLQSVKESRTETTNDKDKSASLVLEHNGTDGNLLFVINKPEFVLGKSGNVDGCIKNSGMVSRNHCKITRIGEKYVIEDLGSTNGTGINGYKLNPHERYYINNGDKLTLADIDFMVILG